MACITPSGGFEQVSVDEIEDMRTANQEQGKKLKQFFFQRGANLNA